MEKKQKNKRIELSKKKQKAFFIKICDDIIAQLENAKIKYSVALSDIGNEVGFAIGMNTCKNQKDLNYFCFEKNDFIIGYEHGYSLQDGSH